MNLGAAHECGIRAAGYDHLVKYLKPATCPFRDKWLIWAWDLGYRMRLHTLEHGN